MKIELNIYCDNIQHKTCIILSNFTLMFHVHNEA